MKKLPFKNNFFDYSLCLDSLHHLNKKDVEEVIKEIRRVLKKNGKCFISVWNKLQIKFLFRKKEIFLPWSKHQRYYYLYSYLELKKLLLKNNFKILKSGKIFDKNINFVIQK